MHQVIAGVLLLAATLAGGHDTCPYIKPIKVEGGDPMGRWYTYAMSYPLPGFDGKCGVMAGHADCKCVELFVIANSTDDPMLYELKSYGYNTKMENYMFNTYHSTRQSREHHIYVLETDDSLNVHCYVAATDNFETYALWVLCEGDMRMFWLLTREKSPPESLVRRAMKELEVRYTGGDVQMFPVDGSDCPEIVI